MSRMFQLLFCGPIHGPFRIQFQDINPTSVAAPFGGMKEIGMTQSITVEFIKSVTSDDQLTVVGAIQEKLSERSTLMTGEIYNAEFERFVGVIQGICLSFFPVIAD